MSDYSSVENNSAAMAAAIPAATTSTATGAPCSDQMVMVQADYSSAAACYYQQAPMPFAYATVVSESGVSCNYQPPMPHQYYHQQEMQMQPPCLYYYPPPPPPAICGPGQDPMAAAVYGNQGMAPYQGFYQQHSLPPSQHQLPAPAALSQPMQPPPLMQQQPLVVPAPAPLPTSSAPPSSSSAGSCPCCSAPLHQQSQQPQLQPPPQPVQQLQLPQPPQPQQLRDQSRSSSCDSAYRTVSTSDLASVGDINQHPNLQRQMPQQLLAPPPQQQQWARRNSFQQQQQQQPLPAQQPQQQSQQKRWKTGYLRNILYKTEMCRDVAQRGACPRGATCQFAHSDTEVLSPSQHPLYKTAFCFDYKNRGHCQRGDHCFHAHQQVELRPAPPVELQTPPSATGLLRPSQHLQQHLSGSGARRESTPRSLAAGGALASSSGPYKALAARLQQQHQLLQQASGCGSSEKQQSSSLVTSTKQMQFSGSPQQFASAERRLSLSGTAGSRSGF